MHHVGNEYTKSRKVVIKCPKCRITRTDAALTHGFDWLDNVAIAAWNQRTGLADLEAQLALYKKALELAVERLYNFYRHDCDLCPVDYVALCRFGPIRDCWQHIGDQIINEAKEALADGRS